MPHPQHHASGHGPCSHQRTAPSAAAGGRPLSWAWDGISPAIPRAWLEGPCPGHQPGFSGPYQPEPRPGQVEGIPASSPLPLTNPYGMTWGLCFALRDQALCWQHDPAPQMLCSAPTAPSTAPASPAACSSRRTLAGDSPFQMIWAFLGFFSLLQKKKRSPGCGRKLPLSRLPNRCGVNLLPSQPRSASTGARARRGGSGAGVSAHPWTSPPGQILALLPPRCFLTA